MSIDVGHTLPHARLNLLRDGIEPVDTQEVFAGRKVVLFAVPGAFTPTCSAKHLPGFVQAHDQFKARGIDVACLSVNDAFVMAAWGKSQNVPEGMWMLADGNAEFTRALGLELDATGFGMGLRAKRFALYADDGVVKHLAIEPPGEFGISSAQAMLEAIND
ncbi:MAG: peroxiredoxin [Xanthomonadales bacterium]|nr:peroxiredoxin [Xanthomonadales bacterium]